MAAQELHVTQPSVSKAIKALERELQVKLMDEKLLLAVPRDSWLSQKETVRLRDLQNENFLVLKPGGSIRMISDRKFKEMEQFSKLAVDYFGMVNVH